MKTILYKEIFGFAHDALRVEFPTAELKGCVSDYDTQYAITISIPIGGTQWRHAMRCQWWAILDEAKGRACEGDRHVIGGVPYVLRYIAPSDMPNLIKSFRAEFDNFCSQALNSNRE